ncbi:MAG: hypothetical protein FJ009_00185 [Chloroflexi bacterium]|nr:hypothetical protein [Chloroflexota bacterium]
MEKFEDKYLDVLHNIETALVHTYDKHAEMTDWEARDAVKALMRTYKAERDGRAEPNLNLKPLTQEAYTNVKMLCDWRLGRATILTEDGKPPAELPLPKTLDEMIACLQRVLRSIEMWQKEFGRRGYYDFVNGFVR